MTQSKKVIYALVAVIALGAGYLALKPATPEVAQPVVTQEQQEVVTNNTEVLETPSVPTPSGKKMAFSEFIKQGGAYKCTVNQYVQDMEMKGTVYINGDMVRGEYAMQVQGMNVDSNMVVRDGYTYSWSSMMPTGYKSKIVAPEETTNPDTGTSGTYSWNAEQIGDYNCESWSPDEAIFALPAGMTFTEMN